MRAALILITTVLAVALGPFAGSPVSAQRGPISQQLVFTPYRASGIYEVGETVGWTVTPGPEAPAYAYKWTIRRNNAVVLKEGTLVLSSGRATIEIGGDQPGMIYVAVQAFADLTAPPAPAAPEGASSRFTGGNTGRNTGLYAVGAAVAPAKIGLSTPRPADFDAFWDGKLAEQAKIPIDAALTPVETDVPGVAMSIFELRALGSKARGYVAKPSGEGKFPALIQLQYAGVYALNARAAARRAAEGWLILNVDSHDKLPSDPSGNVPRTYQSVGNTDREASYFLNMYLRDVRGVDYVSSRPDWDGRTLALMGTSMGGQQSLVTAALHPKVTAVLVNEPAGAHASGDLHGRKAGYPNWDAELPQVMQTARYFDVVNFAPRITAPAVVTLGFIDTITPPVGIWTAFNQMRGPKELIPMIESDHNNRTPEKQGDWEARWRAVLTTLVGGGTFVPTQRLPLGTTP